MLVAWLAAIGRCKIVIVHRAESYADTANLNIVGYDENGSLVDSTYNGGGFRTTLWVLGQTVPARNMTAISLRGVTLATSVVRVSDTWIQFHFTLRNTMGTSLTFNLSVDADVQVGDDDEAPIDLG
jgi:hypothetical protein